MNIDTFSQLGMGIASLAVLSYFLKEITKYFIKTIEKKDIRYTKTVNLFNKTVNNHIDHATKSMDKQNKVLGKLVQAVVKLEKKK